MSEKSASYQPRAVALKRRESLRIEWADGHVSVFPLAVLRTACPCASCRDKREKDADNPLRIVQAATDQARMVVAAGAEIVGNYALRITWEDGHDTGIYDFRMLRELDPGEEAASEIEAGT